MTKNLTVLSRLVSAEHRPAIAARLKVSVKTVEAVLKGKQTHPLVMEALMEAAAQQLAQLTHELQTLRAVAATEQPEVSADPNAGTAGRGAEAANAEQAWAAPAQPETASVLATADHQPPTPDGQTPKNNGAIRSRSGEEKQRLARLIGTLNRYQTEFINSQNGTYSGAYDHDAELLAACFALHQQGYSKSGVMVFLKQNALSVFDQEKAYAMLPQLQADYIDHLRKQRV
ncbi:MAG: hypothetical protein MUC97_09225 [Bernardetiaceae bacterium]|jgi:flagellar capping protein FliD|nr:hypothetical protein [Bernardetiaceae bacterium]